MEKFEFDSMYFDKLEYEIAGKFLIIKSKIYGKLTIEMKHAKRIANELTEIFETYYNPRLAEEPSIQNKICLEINGEVKTAKQWAILANIPYRTLVRYWHGGHNCKHKDIEIKPVWGGENDDTSKKI